MGALDAAEKLKKWFLSSKLKKAMKKVNLFLSTSLKFDQWRLASILGAQQTRRYARHLSFSEVGLYSGCSCSEESTSFEESGTKQMSSFRSFRRLRSNDYSRMIIPEDVDTKADMFIQNFYRQLRMERQVSLDLRYCRSNDNSYSTSTGISS